MTSNRGETQYNSHDGISLAVQLRRLQERWPSYWLFIHIYPGSAATNQAFPDTHIWRDAALRPQAMGR